jgi:hypothetical protein
VALDEDSAVRVLVEEGSEPVEISGGAWRPTSDRLFRWRTAFGPRRRDPTFGGVSLTRASIEPSLLGALSAARSLSARLVSAVAGLIF